jgi:hypothetical protein
MAKHQQAELDINGLKEFLTHIINNNRYLQSNGKMPAAVDIQSPAGIGKTSAVLQLAEEMNLSCIKLSLAQIEELGDLIGFPVRQFQVCKTDSSVKATPEIKHTKVPVKKIEKRKEIQKVTVIEPQEITEYKTEKVKKQILENGKFVTREIEVSVPYKTVKDVPVEKDMEVEVDVEVESFETVNSNTTTVTQTSEECIWVDEQALPEYTRMGYSFTGNKRMAYCPPEWIADKSGGGVLILDDWTRADIRLIQAAMEICDRQEYISWKLPKDWHVVLTSNPDDGEYLVNTIDNAQRTRFIGVKLKFNVDVWAAWAEKENIDGRCINFLMLHPELITKNKDINARCATTFFNAISSIEDFSEKLPLIKMIGDGSVGPEFAQMFSMFINNRLDKLISPKDILLHDNEQYVIGELKKAIGVDKDYRADIASILTTRMINWGLNYAEDHTINKSVIDRLIKLSTDDVFTDDLKYIIVKKFLNGNKTKFAKMMTDPKVIEMSMK